MSNLLRKVSGGHPLVFTIIATVVICAVMTFGVLYWGWDPSDWDLPGM